MKLKFLFIDAIEYAEEHLIHSDGSPFSLKTLHRALRSDAYIKDVIRMCGSVISGDEYTPTYFRWRHDIHPKSEKLKNFNILLNPIINRSIIEDIYSSYFYNNYMIYDYRLISLESQLPPRYFTTVTGQFMIKATEKKCIDTYTNYQKLLGEK